MVTNTLMDSSHSDTPLSRRRDRGPKAMREDFVTRSIV